MKTIRVFVSSPGDVEYERRAVEKLVSEVNVVLQVLAPEKAVTVEAIRWESHTWPAAGSPQSVINKQIGEYDIFFGIMWCRFGTPTDAAGSGTEEEFDRAYAEWKRSGKPEIMFYFSQAPARPPKSEAEIRQRLKVVQFRDRLSPLALTQEYESREEFADLVRPKLLKSIAAILYGQGFENHEPEIPASVLGEVREKVTDLVRQYSACREEQPSGPARTRRLELIVSRIRALSLHAAPLLPSFAQAPTVAERLVASVILQVFPKAAYLGWLSQRLSDEHAFAAYHASLALLTAARNLDCSCAPEIDAAIQDALARLGPKEGSDRQRVLQTALTELQSRCPRHI